MIGKQHFEELQHNKDDQLEPASSGSGAWKRCHHIETCQIMARGRVVNFWRLTWPPWQRISTYGMWAATHLWEEITIIIEPVGQGSPRVWSIHRSVPGISLAATLFASQVKHKRSVTSDRLQIVEPVLLLNKDHTDHVPDPTWSNKMQYYGTNRWYLNKRNENREWQAVNTRWCIWGWGRALGNTRPSPQSLLITAIVKFALNTPQLYTFARRQRTVQIYGELLSDCVSLMWFWRHEGG